MADIKLDYVVPAEDLQPFVTLFYHFLADVPLFEDVERADHAQLRFRLSRGDASYAFPDETEQPAGEVHIVGPTSGAFRTRAAGPVEVIGMGLQPAGWAALLGIDASAMLNRALDGEVFFGPAVRHVCNRMRAAEGTGEKVAVAAAFIRGSIAAADTGAMIFARQIDAWLAGSPSPDVSALVEATGLSRRQVERRCNALYGAPPKLLARKYRALRAGVALANGSATLDELIAEGFYDQSHLIRELKQFTGLTPRQLSTEPSHLAQLTMSQRLALGGRVHPIISDT
ncbi:helix-turn-helix domain-containing protein [Sphingomonas sp. CL5.1]|uniref:helix-turn-helix domain-containing protein n=1 Tax=Sphingomonas sp. CL5.1 TaxID=2653203 RepID=UPI00158304E7|nr:helix-turn-helix domain-containing protein [Sphingomonas sp. CL5.1]QKS01702.1 helix-turn-helix domain-containing protein [Sphingomonas sp. CL5.1]